MMNCLRFVRGGLASALLLSSLSTFAQTATYEVTLDADRNESTGCSLTTSGGTTIAGIETRLQATVDTGSQTVNDLSLLTCNGTTFSPGSSLGGGYPVALNQGVGGADVIELAVEQSDAAAGARGSVQLGFVADDGSGSDTLVTVDGSSGGAPILLNTPFAIPSLTIFGLLLLAALLVAAAWFANRRAGHFMMVSAVLLVALAAWASQHAADGNLVEWAGTSPRAQDPAGDASNGSAALDIRAAFAVLEERTIYFRVDVADMENQAPDAQSEAYSTDEDTTLNVAAPGVLDNDSDPEGDPITAVLDSAPANAGSFTLNADGSFDYTPQADFNGSDSFTYFANDGQVNSAAATVTITVNAINDAPDAVDDDATTNEDQAIDIDVLANDSDVDGNLDPGSVTVTAAPSNGTTSVNATTGVITYTKSGDFNGTDSFDYEVCDDGSPTPVECATATVNVTIDDVNDAPSFTAGGNVTVAEDSGAFSAAWASNIDPGAANESGQALTFNVIANDNAGLFGAGPVVDAGGTLSFTPASDANGTASITVELSDDGGTANGGNDTSAPATFVITVDPVNDAPTFTSGGDVDIDEDSGGYSAPWATGLSAGPVDESAQTLSFSVTGNDNPGLFSAAPSLDASGNLSFTPAADAFGTASITVELSDDGGTANGGNDTSAPVTFAINVNAVNDEPSFTPGGDITVNEDSAPFAAAWASAIDPGAANEAGQTLSFNVTANDNPGLFAAGPGIDASGSLSFTPATDSNGTANITVELADDGGTANGGDDTSAPASFTITIDPVNDAPTFASGGNVSVLEDSGAFNQAWASNISAGPADESGQSLSFAVTGNDNPGLFSTAPTLDASGNLSFTPAGDAFGIANITVELSDDGGTANGGSDTSAPVNFSITIDGVNDAPSFTSGGDVAVDEDSGAYNAAWAGAINPGAPNEAGQTLSFNITNITNPTLFSAAPAVAAGGSLSFTPATDANGSAQITVELMDDGGTANGGVDVSAPPVTFTITVNPVNDPPIISAPGPFDATGNVSIQVTDGADDLLTGVSDPADGTNAQPFSVTTGPVSSAMGGDVSINADGSFSYDPPPGYEGADSFNYEICDSGEPGSACTTASVTVNVSDMVWFVDPSAPAGGDGRLGSPFNDIDTFDAVNDGTGNNPAAGDDVFLYSGTHDGGVTLLDNQRIFGQSATATLSTLTGIALPTYSAPFPPTNTGTTTLQATNATAVTLGQGNTLRGFDIGNTGTGTGVAGTGFGNLGISEMIVFGTGQALDLDTGTATVTLDSIQSSGSDSDGVRLSDLGGSFTITGGTVIDNAAGIGVNIQNVSAAYSFGNVTVDNRNSAGVFINGFTGGVQNGQFGTVTINNQNASNTTALGIDNTTGGDISVAAAVIDNGGANSSGIALSGNAATIDILGGSVSNASGAAVSISSGNGSISYAGGINNASGRSVQVLNNSGGAINLSGSVSDNGTGVLIDNNGTAAVNLTGTLNLSTGANTAFTATNGGIVSASGPNSVVTTTTGTGANITNATIGAGGVTFRSISVNGAPNGIRLVNTGSSGDFIVTGDGTLARNGSGGTIQNTTDDGVYLENANEVILQQMDILDVGNQANPADITNTTNDHAVESRGGGNITLSAVHIQDPIGTGWEAFDITGNNSIDNGSLVEELDRTSNFAGLRVTNTSVDFGSVSITNSTFDHADPTPGDAANNGNAMVVISTRGTASGTFNVDGSTFTGARATAITVNSGDTAGSSGTLTSNIRTSSFEVAHPINGQNNIGMQAIQNTTHNKLVDGNTLRDVGRGGSLSGQIIMQKSDTAVMDAQASNNVISEIDDQHGLDALSLSTSTGGRVDWEADSNTIFGVGRRGIYNSARGNEPDMDVAIRNNTVGRDDLGNIDPVGSGTLAQRGMELHSTGSANLQGLLTNNEVIANTTGDSSGGLATSVLLLEVEDFEGGTAIGHVSLDGNTLTNQDGTGSPNVLARTRDSGLTLALDFNATTADGMSSSVIVEEVAGSTVTLEDLATVESDNPGVSSFIIDAGVTDHGGNVPEPDF